MTHSRIRSGELLGDYRVLEEIPGLADPVGTASAKSAGSPHPPRGAAVYKAQHKTSEDVVAIRVYPSQLAREPERLASLRDGLRQVARLNHPHIVTARGSGMQAGQPYVVLSYLPAGSLQDRIASGLAWTLDRSELIGQLIGVLSFAHGRGLVHGDLKPTKILFDENGAAHVVGFGEAQARPHAPIARSGGSGGYQPPDLPERGPLDAGADQYSLGVILLELFTGCPPEAALAALHAGQVPSDPAAAHAGTKPEDFPKEVWEVLRRATARDPGQQFGTLEAMHRALRVALGLEAPPRQAAEQPLPAARQARKRRRRLAPVVIAVLLSGLCAVVAGPAFSAHREGWQLRDLPGLLLGESGTTQPPDQRPVLALGIELPAEATSPHDEPASPAPGLEPQQPAAFDPAASLTDQSTGAQPEAAPLGPTDAPQPTSTPVLIPTSTPILTATSDVTDTPVPAPTSQPTDPGPEPTMKPGKCKDDPNHPNYCTPTP